MLNGDFARAFFFAGLSAETATPTASSPHTSTLTPPRLFSTRTSPPGGSATRRKPSPAASCAAAVCAAREKSSATKSDDKSRDA